MDRGIRPHGERRCADAGSARAGHLRKLARRAGPTPKVYPTIPLTFRPKLSKRAFDTTNGLILVNAHPARIAGGGEGVRMPSLKVQDGLWTCQVCGSVLTGVLGLAGWRLRAPEGCLSAELCTMVSQRLAQTAAQRARTEQLAAE